jgi:hypothetical protein
MLVCDRTGGQKPGLMDENTSLQPADAVKNPVYWVEVRLRLNV